MRAVFARAFFAVVVGLSAGSCSGSDSVKIDDLGNGKASNDGGTSGTGSCRQEDCPGTDTECATRACKDGACAMDPKPYGTQLKEQKAGDCRTQKCDGEGRAVAVVDETDVPDDQNPCTLEECVVGSVSIRNAPEGTSCGASLKCDGHGVCVGCNTASDCPGSDTECRTRTCENHQCGVTYVPAGMVTTTQVAGDCLKSTCDGEGNVTPILDNTDVPVDGNACTKDVCTAGVPSNPPTASGTACGANGSSLCDGNGACVECIKPTDCPGVDDECKKRTCTSGKCGVNHTPNGTPVSQQTAGDCKERRCNGAGAIVSVNLDSDTPNDNNPCTKDVCAGGVPSNPPETPGTACNANGGLVCDGSGACVECVAPTTCPGSDDECKTRVCAGGKCDMSYASPETQCGDQKSFRCDGAGTCAPPIPPP